MASNVSHNRGRSRRLIRDTSFGVNMSGRRQIVPDIGNLESEGSRITSGYLSDPLHSYLHAPVYLFTHLSPDLFSFFSFPSSSLLSRFPMRAVIRAARRIRTMIYGFEVSPFRFLREKTARPVPAGFSAASRRSEMVVALAARRVREK